jgi:ketosteroid isomerase-like protein
MQLTRNLFLAAFAMAAAIHAGAGFAADAAPRDEDRKLLRVLMAEAEAGINAQSADRLIALMSDDVTVTWLNAEVSRGKAEVKAYHQRMVGGPGTILKKYVTRVSLSRPARFYGDMALADGKAADEFYPHARGEFRLDSNWSSTMAKVDGQWKIVALHLSSNVFTNPLLAEAERMVYYAAGGGFLAGLVLMFLILRLRRR